MGHEAIVASRGAGAGMVRPRACCEGPDRAVSGDYNVSRLRWNARALWFVTSAASNWPPASRIMPSMSQRPQDLHHRPPGRPHRLPPELAGHEPPINAECQGRAPRNSRPHRRGQAGQDAGHRGTGTEHGDLLAGFARDGILNRQRLRRIGLGLGLQYVLLPGLAQCNSRSRISRSAG